MIMLDNDDDPKQYDQTYQTIQPRLPTCASSTAARTGTDCLNHHRQKEKKIFSFFLVWCRLGWNILSSSSLSKSSWLKTLSISSLSIISGSSLLEYNSLNLHPCRCHYDYQFQVLILIIVHAQK